MDSRLHGNDIKKIIVPTQSLTVLVNPADEKNFIDISGMLYSVSSRGTILRIESPSLRRDFSLKY